MDRVLVIGGGAREHALVDALSRSPTRPEILVAPGNAGIGQEVELIPIPAHDVAGLVTLAKARAVSLVVVGPEGPLVLGLSDALAAAGVPVLGPSRAAAAIEGSKSFAKALMQEAGVPTAGYGSFDDAPAAIAFSRSLALVPVVKADGLAAGKGVVVADDRADAEAAIVRMLGGEHGEASRRVVIEERLEGEELSLIGVSDGTKLAILPGAQDHKRVGEGDTGPNTGGMGAYAPAPQATPALLEEVKARIMLPVLARLAERGTPFRGFLYAGLMLTAEGPKVIEFNARFGDPEAEAILPILSGDAYGLMASAARGALDQGCLGPVFGAALTVVLAAAGYPQKPRTGDVIHGLDAAAALEGVRVFHGGTQLVDGQLVSSGGRVLAVTGLGPSLSAAAARAYAAADVIQFEGKHFRRDIGRRAFGPRP